MTKKVVTQEVVDTLFERGASNLWTKIKNINKDATPFDSLLEKLDLVLLHEVCWASSILMRKRLLTRQVNTRLADGCFYGRSRRWKFKILWSKGNKIQSS